MNEKEVQPPDLTNNDIFNLLVGCVLAVYTQTYENIVDKRAAASRSPYMSSGFEVGQAKSKVRSYFPQFHDTINTILASFTEPSPLRVSPGPARKP